jgi:hypothetical protein
MFEIPQSTQDRISKFFNTANTAKGLELEFKKIINNFIFQKYAYSKEISDERLARRVSSYTTEKTILEYAQLFDRNFLASCLNTITEIAIESPSYQSFNDLFGLFGSLSNLHENIMARQTELLDDLKKSEEVKDKINIDGKDLKNEHRIDGDINDILNVIENNEKTKNEITEQSILKASLLSNPLISTIKNNDTNIIENVLLNATIGTNNNNNFSNVKKAISSQLGLKNDYDLDADLNTDYSLDLIVAKNNDYDFNFDSSLLSDFNYGNSMDYPGKIFLYILHTLC